MILGFTGTTKGMTAKQMLSVAYLFETLPCSVLHHGDCVGADATAHGLAKSKCARVNVHPPLSTTKRAFCRNADKVHEPAPPLVRNMRIAEGGIHGLIATPRRAAEELRSGTWATVRYARALHRRVYLVLPDGTVRIEEPTVSAGNSEVYGR